MSKHLNTCLCVLVCPQYECTDEKDPERLAKLFEVTQAIMLIKGTQAQVAEEELADKATFDGKSTAKKGQCGHMTCVSPALANGHLEASAVSMFPS